MAGENAASHRRDPIKNTVGNAAVQRRRQHAVSVAKERREAMFRTKRLCTEVVSNDMDVAIHGDMMIEEEPSILEAQTLSAVEELKLAISSKGKDTVQKKVNALRELRRLLSRSEFPFVEIALKSGAIPLLSQCLSFGSQDEQLLEAAWCLTNIAAGKPEETKALVPTLPLLIAHLGDKSSLCVAEQCAWALGNVAGESEELRDLLLSQGALIPLAKMIFPDKGTTVRTASWALSNLIKGPHPEAATEFIKIDGVVDAILRHLKKSDVELATEVAWVVVYLSAISDVAINVLMNTEIVQVLVDRLASSNTLQSLIPLLRSLGNLMAGDAYTTNILLDPGHETTDSIIRSLSKCLKSEHRFLKKEATWVLSNIAAGSVAHKQLICKSEAVSLLLELLVTSPFDIKKEVAYVLGNLCVAPNDDNDNDNGSGIPFLLLDHLISFVRNGCLCGFIDLVKSSDLEAARLGLHFIELVLRGMPNGEGQKLVERADGIDAMERFQFHENDELRVMANLLVDSYFGEMYGVDE
ncbi:importin subunit alpha-9 isoform X1 [Lactuca sativa]|uniref:importin subunit alpha-9 isoform X1 n=1 Tax=Lactuca sativa TaxID=4236 RepID=UPI000CD988FE|nr:importin subunit alpha-9 isoform X1 [Lactuca sativa]